MRRIVVGVDGSASSEHALRWAVEEAALRGDEVLAVHSYVPLEAQWAALPELAIATIPPDVLQQDAEERVRRSVQRALEGVDTTVAVTTAAIAGRPADVLREASDGADMLVVGSRGMGGFRGLLLGSVSHQVLTHATVPTVVVPYEE